MRFAHNDFGSPPIGVEPQPTRHCITIQDYDGRNVVRVTDRAQAAEVIGLLEDAAEILGWPKLTR